MSEEANNIIFKNIEEQLKDIKCMLEKLNTNYFNLKDEFMKQKEEYIRSEQRIYALEARNERKDKELYEVLGKNEREHQELMGKFDKMNLKMATYAGAIAVIVFVVQYLLSHFMKNL